MAANKQDQLTKIQLAPNPDAKKKSTSQAKITTGWQNKGSSGPKNPIDSSTGEPLNRANTYLDKRNVAKGALIAYDGSALSGSTMVVFQYNPEELSRTLKANYKPSKGPKRMIAVPTETISLTIKLQAVDSMIAKSKAGDKTAAALGLYGKLAQLELMLYPASEAVKTYVDKLKNGKKGAVPASAKPVLFHWGGARVLPVLLTSITVTETMFNIALAPIAASVKIDMEVKSLEETTDMSYELLFANLVEKEDLAVYQTFS